MSCHLDSERVSRAAGGAQIFVWSMLGICVVAATAYDVSHWVTGW
jgi:hypothetical protein